MSTTIITIEKVLSVEPHPDADRLDVIMVLGYQVITGKGTFQVGDDVIYFPPDIMIPAYWSDALGVTQYLKHARMSMDTTKHQCRVAACRLRGLPSYGFVAPITTLLGDYEIGQDLTSTFNGEKYEPPVRLGGGDAEPDMPNFHRYSGIENIQRCNQFEVGEEVVFTEKIHGTNCRMGLVADPKQPGAPVAYQAGSNKLRRKEGEGLYWSFFSQTVRDFLDYHCHSNDDADVVLFGEIYGPASRTCSMGRPRRGSGPSTAQSAEST